MLFKNKQWGLVGFCFLRVVWIGFYCACEIIFSALNCGALG